MSKVNEARTEKLLSVGRYLANASLPKDGKTTTIRRDTMVRKLNQIATRDADLDDDPNQLAQSIDAVLDEALEAFQSNQTDQGVGLVVAAAATVDALLEALGLPDADEVAPDNGDTNDNGGMGMASKVSVNDLHFRAVDNSAWDGPAAMSRCASSDSPASCYEGICAGKRAGDAKLQSSWALPHHSGPNQPANATGVRNALGRFNQTDGLTNKAAAQAHLEAHLKSINAASAGEKGHPRSNLFRAMEFELRQLPNVVMPVMNGQFARYNEWTEIDSMFEGRFLERVAPQAFDQTFAEDRDNMKVLFQHGRDPQIGSKVLGPIDVLEPQRDNAGLGGAYYEVPLLDTSYNRDLLPGLALGPKRGGYGASFRFDAREDQWVDRPERSDFNPQGLPERTITNAQVMEFGPVTFPAYVGATAGLRSRSLTDAFIVTGRSDAGSVDGGATVIARPGDPIVASQLEIAKARDRALRLQGVI